MLSNLIFQEETWAREYLRLGRELSWMRADYWRTITAQERKDIREALPWLAPSRRSHAPGGIHSQIKGALMSTLPPHEAYQKLCHRVKRRIEHAKNALSSGAPKWEIVETVSLQGRKAIETIAHMSLVAVEHSLGELGIPRDAKKQWNAETIFERLKEKNINVLPSPSRMSVSDNPRYKAVFAGVPENRLSYDDLIERYRMFHEALHDINPYRPGRPPNYFDAHLAKVSDAIARIRRFTWVHFIGLKGQGFAVDLCNKDGLTVVVPLSAIVRNAT